jgi:GAF domain-containing protein
LFLVDEQRQWAVLQAGTGQAGQAMLTRGHRLAVDNNSMIGWSIVNAQARIAMQAETDTVRRTTAELPETRSEAALPLRSRGQVLGALTVQSTQPDIFDQDIITVLQTMADQIGIALENARLLAESQAAVEISRRASGELSREGWRQLIHTQAMAGVRSAESGVTVVSNMEAGDVWPAEARHALRTGQTVHATDPGDPVPMAVPVQVRGNVIGVIDTFKPSGSQWTPEEITLAETLAEQLGIALESARLYQDTRERAARERLVGEVTGRIRETLDMETMLRTATGEIRQALNLGDLVIRLLPPKADDQGK